MRIALFCFETMILIATFGLVEPNRVLGTNVIQVLDSGSSSMSRVHWRVLGTGKTGHGEEISTETAHAWARHMNNLYSEAGTVHWVE